MGIVVMTALGVAVEWTKPADPATPSSSSIVTVHFTIGYRSRGGGRSVESGPYDPVGLITAYLAGGRVVSTGVVPSGFWTGKHIVEG